MLSVILQYYLIALALNPPIMHTVSIAQRGENPVFSRDGLLEPISSRPITLMVLLEREDLICPLCREAFTALCDTLNRYRRLLNTHCIVKIDPLKLPSTLEPDEAMHIIRDQINGLLIGLGADFILYLDTCSVIHHDGNTPALIMLHHPFRLIRKWKIPMPLHDMNELRFFIKAMGDMP